MAKQSKNKPVVTIWRLVQCVTGLLAPLVFLLLLLAPDLGMKLFYGIIITLGPLLFVLIPSIWRNICPLALLGAMPHLFGFSRAQKPSSSHHLQLLWLGLFLLMVIPPLRPLLFDRSAVATAVLLGAFGVFAFVLGVFYDARSGFCASVCPVYPVEVLYGQQPVVSVNDAVCGACSSCVSVCYEKSKKKTLNLMESDSKSKSFADFLIGGFPGYVYGWFQIPVVVFADFDVGTLWTIYFVTFSAMFTSLGVYYFLKMFLGSGARRHLPGAFAAVAVAIYYWYRVPVVLGFGKYPGLELIDLVDYISDEKLVVLRSIIPLMLLLWFGLNEMKRPQAVEAR